MENDNTTQVELTPKQKVGILIKSIREESGESTADIAKKFHCTEESIVKFESGNPDNSQSEYYQRMFAIRFIKRMNKNTAENMKIIDAAYPSDSSNTIIESSKIAANVKANHKHRINNKSNYNPSQKKKRGKQAKSIILFIIVLLLIVLSVGALYKVLSVRLNKEVENPTQLVENTELTPEKVTEAKVVEKTTKVKKGELVDGVQEYSITELPEDSYKLKLEFSGDDYIAIFDEDTSDSLATSKVYKDGEDVTATIKKSTESVLINVGAGQEVKIYINDEELDTSDFPSGQIYVRITNDVK